MTLHKKLSQSGGARRLALVLPLLLAGIVLLAFIALQALAKNFLREWLLDNGADSVTIETLWFNPVSGRISLNGVEIVTAGDTVYSDDTLKIDVGIPALFQQDALLEKVVLRDMHIDIRKKDEGGMRIGSYPLDDDSDSATKQDTSLFPPWTLRILQMDLQNIRIRYQGAVEALLVIDEAHGSHLDSGSKQPNGTFTLKGTLNGSLLSFELNRFHLDQSPAVSGKITLTDFDLSDLTGLLPATTTFEGTASLDGSFAYEKSEAGISVPMFEGSIMLSSITAADQSWEITGNFEWLGTIRPSPKSGITFDGSLDGTSPTFSQEKKRLLFAARELQADGQLVLGETTNAGITGDIALSGANLTVDGLDFGGEHLSYQGQLRYKDADPDGAIVFDGKLSGRSVAGDIGATAYSWLLGEGSIEGDGRFPTGGGPPFIGSGTVALDAAKILEKGQEVLTFERLGADDLRGHENGMIQAAKIHGRKPQIYSSSLFPRPIAADSVVVEAPASHNLQTLDTPLVRVEGLTIPGETKSAYGFSIATISVDSLQTEDLKHFLLDRVKLRDTALLEGGGQQVADVAEIAAHQVQGTQEQATVEAVEITKARFRGMEPSAQQGVTALLEHLQTSPITWQRQSGTHVEKINASGLEVTYIVAEKENKGEKKEDNTAEHPPAKDSTFSLVIDTLALDDKGRFTYKDPTLPETFSAEVAIESLRVTDIDLGNPDRPFSLTGEGQVDTYAELTISGSGSLMTSPRSWQHVLALRGYPLTNLSPFLIKSLGTRLTGGKLELQSELELEGVQIDMDNTLEIKHIEMETVDKKRSQQFNQKLPIPLNTALSLLRDDEDTITINIPISGTLSDLDTSYTDIIITALGNGITTAVKPMLAYTVLGPGGVFAYLGMKLGKELISSDLPSLSFAPGETTLNAEHRNQLDSAGGRIMDALEKMEEPLFYIYPKVLPGELSDVDDAALLTKNQRQKLYRLGKQRAERVKDYLLGKFSIDEEHLQVFQPGIIYEEEEQPTVTFMK